VEAIYCRMIFPMKIKIKLKLIFVLEFGSVLGVVGKPSASQT
jgi:hypothetical protein